MSRNLYDALPSSFKKLLDGTDLEDAAKQIDAEVAEQQAKAFDSKLKALDSIEKFRSEFTKAKQREDI